ncbi:MAG: hypothetical protein IT232_07540 [Flavobacteriales bacterium]|nr:hypothetical protein [Flavobacteriales bacterium]
MQKKDKIKVTVALTLVALLVTAFLVFGKESVQLRVTSVFSLIVWLFVLFYSRKK